jgi:hypothetical protein
VGKQFCSIYDRKTAVFAVRLSQARKRDIAAPGHLFDHRQGVCGDQVDNPETFVRCQAMGTAHADLPMLIALT